MSKLRNKDCVMGVRLTKAEKECLQRLAESKGMKLSEYVVQASLSPKIALCENEKVFVELLLLKLELLIEVGQELCSVSNSQRELPEIKLKPQRTLTEMITDLEEFVASIKKNFGFVRNDVEQQLAKKVVRHKSKWGGG
jgi:hypothetical protein